MDLDGLMLTKQKFSKMVEVVVKEKRISYLDAVIHLCEKINIEVEDMTKYISPAIKSKIESEATKLNLMQVKNKSIELE
jgi:hypothetical protein